MSVARKLLWNVYAGALGAATVLVVNKVLSSVWEVTTGHEPPSVDDPGTSTRQAVTWAVASAAGMAVATVLVNRLAAKSWERALGVPAPSRET